MFNPIIILIYSGLQYIKVVTLNFKCKELTEIKGDFYLANSPYVLWCISINLIRFKKYIIQVTSFFCNALIEDQWNCHSLSTSYYFHFLLFPLLLIFCYHFTLGCSFEFIHVEPTNITPFSHPFKNCVPRWSRSSFVCLNSHCTPITEWI